MSDWIDVVTFGSVVAAGVVAGVWFTFSAFVMPALARMEATPGATAMQSINVTAVRPPLMIAMFGLALACLVLGVWAALNLGDSRAPWILAGAAVYLVGTIIVTIVGNVPLNEALDAVDPASAEGHRQWAHHLSAWNVWNHVRTVTGIVATGLLAAGLIQD